MSHLLALVLAGSLVTATPASAYVLDHPIDPELLILATSTGRYAIGRLGDGCDWLRGDLNVVVASASGELAALQMDDHRCVVGIRGKVDETPCFANAAGECDLDAGEHYWGGD